MGDAESSPPYRDDSLCFQRFTVALKEIRHYGDALLCRNIRKAHKASMSDPFNIYEFPEISINGHQNPAFSCCVFEQCLIARVWAHFTGICNIVALTAQPVR